jgi:hypothetical protein
VTFLNNLKLDSNAPDARYLRDQIKERWKNLRRFTIYSACPVAHRRRASLAAQAAGRRVD